MSTLLTTQQRRSMQLLWSKLDAYVAPLCRSGLVLAVSGGPDSRALLESIAKWRSRLVANILVVSINHGLREQAYDEARYVLMRAQRLGFKTKLLELLSNNFNEQELRDRRYELLTRACQNMRTNYVVTAHHQDDNAEGFLMSLLGVGGGAAGAAMGVYEQVRTLTIVRPFVELPKKSLLTALSLNNQTDFAMDNLDLARKGSRAWVRHEIIPGLQGHETNISKRLDYLAQAERHKKAILTKLAENLVEYFESHAVINLENRPEPLLIELATRAVLRNWYKDKDLRQAKSTIAKLAGLDRSPQRFIVNDLKPKEFVLPGAVAYSNGKEIIIKRVGKTE